MILFKMGWRDMKNMMIEDMGIDGLANNADGHAAVMDTMMTVFGFIGLGVLCLIVYTMRLKMSNHLKPPPSFFITHLFWTLPDVVHLAMGSSLHPPIPRDDYILYWHWNPILCITKRRSSLSRIKSIL